MKRQCKNCRFSLGCEYYTDCFYTENKIKFEASESAQIQEILRTAIKRDDSTRNAVFKGLNEAQRGLLAKWLYKE